MTIEKEMRRNRSGRTSTQVHPDHGAQKARLSRIKGQVEGIERMIEERRYCVDIINQIKSAQSALKGLQEVILENHLRECVKTAFSTKNAFDVEKKIQEIVELV